MKILIIEDTNTDATLIKWMLQKMLKALGHTGEIIFERAKNEEDAVRMINENNYDLITIDGNLENNGKGKNVLQNIDQKFWSRIIAISDDEDFLQGCIPVDIDIFHKNDLAKESKEAKFAIILRNLFSGGFPR